MKATFALSTRILIASMALSACASMDRHAYTTFEPYRGPSQEHRFRFFSKSDIIYPANTTEGEAVRMQWLALWLSDNGLCGNGYKIIERKAVALSGWDAAKDIYYVGECM